MRKNNGVKVVIIGIVLLCLVLGYYYHLSNKKAAENEKNNVKLTAVQEALLQNLDKNYPPTPREVIKCFGNLCQCLYEGQYTEEEFLALAAQAQKLYDAELIANSTQEQYIENLKYDINNFKEKKIVISSYSPASSTDVERFTQDGYEWAQMQCVFTLRKGTQLSKSEEIFMLRKDENGHWKIYGWGLDDEERQTDSGY